ncbi:MAG: hypothetical protein Q8M07_31380 [Prosthecobacter sp.]|nr:hypothetical protein [Prosthecobacter sp.]
MKTHLCLLALILMAAQATHAAEDGPLYFSAPEVVVDEATTLLKARDWKMLARHYDLSDSKITQAELESGDYFQPKLKSEGQPSFTGKRPFPVGFKFIDVEKTDDAAVVRVNAGIEIDQGGGPKQRVRTSFLLKKSAQGWQLLPDKP